MKNLFLEAGARFTKTQYVSGGLIDNSTFGRLYGEYTRQFNKSVSGKLWAEYLPNFKDSSAWLLNLEPSVSVMMSQIFFIKSGLSLKHHDKTLTSTEVKDDTTLTTSLVAKF